MGKFGLHIKMTRRQLVLGLASIVGSGLLIKYGISNSDDDETMVAINLPESSHVGPPTYDQFLALSKLVTCKETLNEEVAKKMFNIFLDEPWGPEHIKSTYRALHTATVAHSGKQEMPDLLKGVKLTKGERWFISHLLTTWYLGIYYHEERPVQRITYEGALIYSVLQGTVPIWFTGERTPGYWTEPPSAIKAKKI